MQPSATPSASRRGRHVSGDHDHRDRSRCYRNAPPPCLLPPCHSSRCCRCHRGHSSRGGRRHSHSHRQTPQTPPPSPHGSRPFLHVAAPCRLTTAATSAAVTLSLGRGGGSSHLVSQTPTAPASSTSASAGWGRQQPACRRQNLVHADASSGPPPTTPTTPPTGRLVLGPAASHTDDAARRPNLPPRAADPAMGRPDPCLPAPDLDAGGGLPRCWRDALRSILLALQP
ncbi:Os11g0685400 [Oryza sativa Japonica Group]|uniref:Os11g0685400 protein n=1 Tax=Oryza sativa subsp. japonica TaxID=39947 RepID=Q0IR30_ORYSJ|nr:Os11g0685400 [Oryza sativa Japonica Group]|eukprot:NP_001068472.1 Os11g0685400 [Oryza sativa Japonica Group]